MVVDFIKTKGFRGDFPFDMKIFLNSWAFGAEYGGYQGYSFSAAWCHLQLSRWLSIQTYLINYSIVLYLFHHVNPTVN